MRFIMVAAAAACLVTASGAVADEPVTERPPGQQTERREIVIDLGIGASLQPQYPAAEKYLLQPWPIAELKFLRLPVVGEVVTGRPRAISVYPAFRFIGERDQSDADYLAGTNDVDAGIELGAGVRVERGPVGGYVEVRAGVSGHAGVVADVGVDFVARQHDQFEVRIGPRLGVASDDYMDTYFGVRPTAAVLQPYDPDGGLRDAGIEAEATYALTDTIRLHGYAAYNRFIGEAGDSPIAEAGNKDELRVGLGISYRFGLDLY